MLKLLSLILKQPELLGRRKIDFMIIGAQKSGTSALDSYLRFHPEIGLAFRKELHFFDHDRLTELPALVREIYYHQFFPNFTHLDKVLGENTPNYMLLPLYIDRIHSYNPALKLIVILRDPVSRAYSHWNMQRDRGLERRSFEQVVQKNLLEIQQKLVPDRRFSYVQRGEYARQLKYVSTLFPREQLLVLFQQDLLNSPLDTMNRITQFLGVSPFRELKPKYVNRREYPEVISNPIQNKLKAYFLPQIEDLEQFLEKDLSHWK